MKKYDKEIAQAQLDNEKAVLKQLEANYKDALEEINSKIAELMGRADADMQHVVYQVEYQKALKAQTEAILKTLQNNEFETVSAYLAKCYDEGFISTLYAIQKQGVPLVFPINQEEVTAAIQLQTNLSTSLYEAFDMKDLQKKIAGEISRGFSTGALYSEITRNVASYAQISKNKAMRIVRTEGHRITETAASNAQKRAKDRGADIVKIWDATLDGNTRPSHMRVDGEIKEIGKKFSNGLEFPGDPAGSAAEVINCRCRSRSDARWALEADETKMLGDVSKMSEERKAEIAKKLGVPVDTLDQYSNQIVPIKAKDYADFKRQYDQLWRYEGSALQKEAEERIAGYGKKSVANAGKSSTMEAPKDSGLEIGNKADDLEKVSAQVGTMLNDFTSRASKWSGKTIIGKIEDMTVVSGRKEWTCDITLREDAGIKTAIHEHLHARSVSYYNSLQFYRWTAIEEGTTELFAQEICKQKGIAFRESYKEEVKRLKIINSISKLYDNNYDYAHTLFEIPMTERYDWLRIKANQAIESGNLSAKSITALNEAVDYFKKRI